MNPPKQTDNKKTIIKQSYVKLVNDYLGNKGFKLTGKQLWVYHGKDFKAYIYLDIYNGINFIFGISLENKILEDNCDCILSSPANVIMFRKSSDSLKKYAYMLEFKKIESERVDQINEIMLIFNKEKLFEIIIALTRKENILDYLRNYNDNKYILVRWFTTDQLIEQIESGVYNAVPPHQTKSAT